jgi:hypothetical protein
MAIPDARQPSWDEISRELEAWRRWYGAWQRKERPLPPLPEPAGASGVRFCWGLASRLALAGVAQVGGRIGSPRVQAWSARQRIRTDGLWFETAACALNSAYTDLGLALLEMGDVPGAVECLRRSSKVRPCPHNTSFGPSARLWWALASVPEAAEARAEYERVARRFAPRFDRPRQRLTLVQALRILAKTVWEHERG